eukprot:s1305_g3.t1
MAKAEKSAPVPATRVKGKSSLDSNGKARRVSWTDMPNKKDIKKVQKKEKTSTAKKSSKEKEKEKAKNERKQDKQKELEKKKKKKDQEKQDKKRKDEQKKAEQKKAEQKKEEQKKEEQKRKEQEEKEKRKNQAKKKEQEKKKDQEKETKKKEDHDEKDETARKAEKAKKRKVAGTPTSSAGSGLATPPPTRHAASPSEDIFSPPTTVPREELSDMEKDQRLAKEKGLTLEEHLNQISEREVEEHMKQIVKEQKEKEKTEKEKEKTEKENEKVAEDDESDDEEEDEEEEEGGGEDSSMDDEEEESDEEMGGDDTTLPGSEDSSSEGDGDDGSSSDSCTDECASDPESEDPKGETEKEKEVEKLHEGALVEYWYFVGQGGEMSRETGVEDSTGLNIRDKKPNKEMVMALSGPGGPLGSGAMPRVGRTSEAGEKAILEALAGQPVTKPKKEKTRKTGEAKATAEEMGPKTKQQETVDKKEDVLKSATEARKYGLALKHLNYSGELVRGLMDFSTKMEKIYETILSMVASGVTNEKEWNKILDGIDAQMNWYQQAEAGYGMGSQNQKLVWTQHGGNHICIHISRHVTNGISERLEK